MIIWLFLLNTKTFCILCSCNINKKSDNSSFGISKSSRWYYWLFFDRSRIQIWNRRLTLPTEYDLKVCDDGTLVQTLSFVHYQSSSLSETPSFLFFKTQRFGDWILSPSSGKTYSVGFNRQSYSVSPNYFNLNYFTKIWTTIPILSRWNR
jgi:hypothetical protein